MNLVAAYRGGGLDDWFLPSVNRLKTLYDFGNRNAIGGFADTRPRVQINPLDTPSDTKARYVSSTVETDGSLWVLGHDGYGENHMYVGNQQWMPAFFVRPIRAFS